MRLISVFVAIGLLGGVGGISGGCGSDDTSSHPQPMPTPADTLSPEEAVDGLLTKACEKMFECRNEFPYGDAIFIQYVGETVKDCKTNLVDQLGIAGIAESVEAGSIVYDGEKGAACVDEVDAQLAASTCSELWSQDPTGLLADTSCGAMLIGQVAIGETCENEFECVPGAQCSGGTCAAAN